MKLSTIKRYRRRHRVLGSLLLKNPVLVLGLDLPFVIATSTSLKNAAAISLELFIIHMVTVSAGMLTCRRLPMWQRAMVNAMISTLTMVLAQTLVRMLFPGIANTLGMYLYLMAVNGMTLLQSGEVDKKARPWTVVSGAFLNAAGFALVVTVVSVLREYAGNGTLWGIALPVPIKLSGLLLPFGGFLVMAFVLAFAKFLNKKLLSLAMRDALHQENGYARIKVISEEIL